MLTQSPLRHHPHSGAPLQSRSSCLLHPSHCLHSNHLLLHHHLQILRHYWRVPSHGDEQWFPQSRDLFFCLIQSLGRQSTTKARSPRHSPIHRKDYTLRGADWGCSCATSSLWCRCLWPSQSRRSCTHTHQFRLPVKSQTLPESNPRCSSSYSFRPDSKPARSLEAKTWFPKPWF